MFSDGDEVLRSFFRILLLITHFQVVTVYSFITLISHCADRKSHQLLKPCELDTDCVENSYCHDYNSCYCKENYIPRGNSTHIRCVRSQVVQKIGDPCEENVQCQVKFGHDAECRENRCQCVLDSQFVEERCYRKVGLGDYCQSSRNCYVEGSLRRACSIGRCVCPFLYHSSKDRTRCVKDIALKENCTKDEECIAENSRCIVKCRCDINHVISSNNSVCLKTANAIGEPCEEDLQCQDLNFSKCRKGKCSCIKGYHRRSTTCHLSVGLNRYCENHAQCITLTNVDSDTFAVRNVDCINRVCACSADHTLTLDGLDCIGYAENSVSSWRLSPIALIVATFIVVN